MKTTQHKTWVLAAGFALSTVATHAFTYNPGDLMLNFRQTGSRDLEVNIGSVVTYRNLGPGQQIVVSQYTGAQLTAAFSSLDGLSFGVMSAVPIGQTVDGQIGRTLWVTNPRIDVNVQSTPFLRKTGSSQGNTTSIILGVAGLGSASGAVPWSAGTSFDSVTNSSTAIIISATDSSAYSVIAGTSGDLGLSYGNIENITPSGFTSGQYLRSDLYEAAPRTALNQDATYLGYFEFGADGVTTFNSVPEPGTFAILALGGLSLLCIQRLRRNNQ